jgi:hypothetical protein
MRVTRCRACALRTQPRLECAEPHFEPEEDGWCFRTIRSRPTRPTTVENDVITDSVDHLSGPAFGKDLPRTRQRGFRMPRQAGSASDWRQHLWCSVACSPYAHPFHAVGVRVCEKVSAKTPARRTGPWVCSGVRLYDPKGARQRDALRCGMVLKKLLERRAHRVSLLGR